MLKALIDHIFTSIMLHMNNIFLGIVDFLLNHIKSSHYLMELLIIPNSISSIDKGKTAFLEEVLSKYALRGYIHKHISKCVS